MTTNKKVTEDESLKSSAEKSDSKNLDSRDSLKTEQESSGGQLFFSTDGEESTKTNENPYLDEKDSPNQNESSSDQPGPALEVQADNLHNSTKSPHNHNHATGQKGNRKQNWQDKKRQKNRPRQKFKRPRKLPFEETESRPLEIGELLENESICTENGLGSLAQEFAGTEHEALELDELLPLNLLELKEKVIALPISVELSAAPLREEILDALLEECLREKAPVRISGVLQVMEDGHGFLLQQIEDYKLKSQCPFVPEPLVKKYGLKTGQVVKGFIRAKMDDASCPILVQIEEVMAGDPMDASRVTPFTELVPYYPLERIFLETDEKSDWDNVSMRVVDLVSPVGFGQRGLIVAPPRTGKTVLQQGIARALRVNNPQAHLIVLLVDERPEEVTDFRRQVPDAEVIASTFDEPAESHVHAAEIVIEKARRMVEHNQDVVILLDSITRLARAYNTTMPNSGKILSGGVEASALQRPKRFFGSARNIEGGGSLTILGTALVETGSKMDEVIFEEFKGTGNMELHLDRELSNKRIFPALDFEKSGTRKEELLYHPDELTKIYSLRRSLKGVPPAEAMEMFIQRVRKTKNNPEFLMGLGR